MRNWNAATLTDPSQCLLSPTNTETENICTLYGYDPAGRQIGLAGVFEQKSTVMKPLLAIKTSEGHD